MGCHCVIGYDVHDHQVYETDTYLQRVYHDLKRLEIEVVDTIPFRRHSKR